MKIKELKPNEKNPRKISAEDKESLKESLHKFGDLGGIVYNRTSKRIVSGHQRASVIDGNEKIVIEQTYKTPTRTGTVAEGHIISGGERYNYREVEWNVSVEAAALIAANKHGGEWDEDLLKLNLSEIDKEDLAFTGFDDLELKDLGIELELAPLEENVLNEVYSSSEHEEEDNKDDETDEQYVKNQEKTTEQVPQEKIPSTDNVTPYDKTEEVKGIVNKKIMLIIECPNQETKDSLKEKLQPEITQAGCKIF